MTTRRRRPIEPTTLLFGEDHRRLLGLLLMRPDEDYHVREISRLTKVDAGNAQRALKLMEQAGLLKSNRAGNQVRYKANRASPIFPELQGIVRKTVGLGDVLRKALEPLSSRIETAFVFGSVARGEEGPTSDIDLMVIGTIGFDDVVIALHPVHERLGREINAVVMKRSEFRRRLKENSFIKRVMSGEKLVLIGTLDEP